MIHFLKKTIITIIMIIDFEDNADINSVLKEVKDRCKKIEDEFEIYY